MGFVISSISRLKVSKTPSFMHQINIISVVYPLHNLSLVEQADQKISPFLFQWKIHIIFYTTHKNTNLQPL